MTSNLPKFSATEQSPAFKIWTINEARFYRMSLFSFDLNFEAFKFKRPG